MVFGVFDLLHPGHINFLKQAKRLGDILVVSVARDVNVQKVKGFRPVFSHLERKTALESLKMVDRVVVGAKNDPWPHIVREKPDVIALGYDQKEYIGNLKTLLKEKGLKQTKVVRLKAFKPYKFKTMKIKQRFLR